MSSKNFKDLFALADELNVDDELLESFSLACRVKNLTPSTLKYYAEQLMCLVRYAASLAKQLGQLMQRDVQNYLMSVMDEVSRETVNGRIRVFRVFCRHLKAEGLRPDQIKSSPWRSYIKLALSH